MLSETKQKYPSGEQANLRRASPAIGGERFLTETEAADFICQSVRTVQKWRVTGFGPKYYKFGRSVRYLKGDILEWVAERSRNHTSQFT
jgi:predicted DNA-binding transcriptional regulator AlpA